MSKSVNVIGAGIVGLSCALWLQREGYRVRVIDPESPGSGTSSGNACTIAEYGCIPINSPTLFRQLPSLLMRKDSPLALNPVYALKRLDWMLDFLMHCRSKPVEHAIHQLGDLLQHAWSGLEPLLKSTSTEDLIKDRGFMHVYVNQKEFDDAWPSNQLRAKHGSKIRPLAESEIYELEPNLKPIFKRGMYFDGIRQVLDPLELCQRYSICLGENGAEFVCDRVQSVNEKDDGVELVLSSGKSIRSDCTIVAAGAFSKFINGLGKAADKLDTERGYHVLYRGYEAMLSRPVSWHTGGFYAVPMKQGMRLSGTVEIAGYSPRENPERIANLANKAHAMLGLPTTPDATWLGFRPTFPDALPAIGYLNRSSRVIAAFGHHHVGLTLSGITGKLVAELVGRRPLSHDISAFSPGRFG